MEKYLGSDIKQLGFGLMRLPKLENGEIDHEQVKEMVDLFMKAGFTYFDTAYVYENGKSEIAARECLVKRYPRESFTLATKMPLWGMKDASELDIKFGESLDRAGVSYFDFYLLHNINRGNYDDSNKFDAWGWGLRKKAEGKIRHLGFSFHDTPELLDKVLTEHPEAEFVQLQINYADWENPGVRSRECYEVARKHGKPVVIMEPVKGGSLAGMAEPVRKVLTDANPNVSVASWAVRYAASLDGLVTVLSGMSNLDQMKDNISYMEDFKPLSNSERAVVAKAVEELNKIPQIPCTECRYCVDGCPQKISIPRFFQAYNNYQLFQNKQGFIQRYNGTAREGGSPEDCIQCGQCESHCPQHLEIIKLLQDVAAATK